MDTAIKEYIDSLDVNSIPWDRMFTAYGTAEHYPAMLAVLNETRDEEEWLRALGRMSDFEHQSTMFPPAPFALVFLVRILRKLRREENADRLASKLTDQLLYYRDVCEDAERMEHAEPLGHFSELLEDRYLLPVDWTDDDLMSVFEDPEAVPDDLFYSLYYYSKIVLSLVTEEGIF